MQIVSLGRPLARGFIKLRNSDPTSNLIIQPNYFEDQKDVDSLVDGLKIAVAIVENTTAFSQVGGRFTDQVFPGCENVRFRSE
jgi:glucose dehydrogenase (acceptor)